MLCDLGAVAVDLLYLFGYSLFTLLNTCLPYYSTFISVFKQLQFRVYCIYIYIFNLFIWMCIDMMLSESDCVTGIAAAATQTMQKQKTFVHDSKLHLHRCRSGVYPKHTSERTFNIISGCTHIISYYTVIYIHTQSDTGLSNFDQAPSLPEPSRSMSQAGNHGWVSWSLFDQLEKLKWA